MYPQINPAWNLIHSWYKQNYSGKKKYEKIFEFSGFLH